MVAAHLTAAESDPQLLARWAIGDEGAFDALYERYAGRLSGYCTRMLGRHEEAEDVVTDTFLRLVERGPRSGELRAWLFTVAHRACVDRLRRRSRRDRLLGLFGWPLRAPPTPEEHLLEGEQDRRAAAAIEALPVAHRAALLLSTVQDLPAAEVGAILGLTDQQVRSQISYARKQLRTTLDAVR